MSTPARNRIAESSNVASALFHQASLIYHNNSMIQGSAVHMDDEDLDSRSHGSSEARLNVALILEKLATADRRAAMKWAVQLSLITELLKLVGESSHSPDAVKAGITALAALYHGSALEEEDLEPLRRLKTSDVAPLIEQLAGATRPKAERILTVLKAIAMCGAEGQASLGDHALTLPTLVRSLLVLSDLSNELAIHVLWLLCMHHGPRLQDAAHLGVAYKLLLILAQMKCSPPTKQRIHDLLKAMRGMRCLTSLHASHRL